MRELNLLLQQIENFCGIVILTTNRHDCFDPALERRLALRLVFGPPDVEDRFQLWKRHIPNKAPMSSDINFEALARDYILTGAQIKNVVLGAARRAAVRISLDDKCVCITQSDILDAIHEEKELTWAAGGKGRLGF